MENNQYNAKEIGARIASVRSANGLTQSQLAKKLGYKSFTTVSKWELGEAVPAISKIIELAKTLNTSSDYILFGKESYSASNNKKRSDDYYFNAIINKLDEIVTILKDNNNNQ